MKLIDAEKFEEYLINEYMESHMVGLIDGYAMLDLIVKDLRGQKEIKSWHRLKDNPDDLPYKETRYEIIYKTCNDREARRDFSEYKYKYGFTITCMDCVIAWREIDEFEY